MQILSRVVYLHVTAPADLDGYLWIVAYVVRDQLHVSPWNVAYDAFLGGCFIMNIPAPFAAEYLIALYILPAVKTITVTPVYPYNVPVSMPGGHRCSAFLGGIPYVVVGQPAIATIHGELLEFPCYDSPSPPHGGLFIEVPVEQRGQVLPYRNVVRASHVGEQDTLRHLPEEKVGFIRRLDVAVELQNLPLYKEPLVNLLVYDVAELVLVDHSPDRIRPEALTPYFHLRVRIRSL